MCSDNTALLCRPSTLSMIFVHNHMFYRSGAFPQCIAASPPDSSVCLQTSEACSTSHWNTPTSDNLFHSQPSSTSPPFFLNQMIFYSSAANFRPSLWLGASVAHVLSHGIPTAAPFPSRPHGQGHQMKWAVRTEDT